MKIIDWEKDLENMSIKELSNLLNALDTLQDWEMFRKEYKGHGLDLLRVVIDNVRDLKQRIAQ